MYSQRTAGVFAAVAGAFLVGRAAGAEEAITPVPTPAVALKAGTYHFLMHVTLGPQPIDLSSTLDIKDGGSTWSVTETVDTPNGQTVDHADLAKPALTVVKRNVQQGPLVISYEVVGDQLRGALNVNGGSQALTATLPSPLIADGAGATAVIAALPLAEAYTAQLAGFNVQTQQVTRSSLKVLGAEKVKVAAGEFDCWKVEILSPLGPTMTVWVSKAGHQAVRTVITVPQMGPGDVTMELMP